jgi:hypothetical protein
MPTPANAEWYHKLQKCTPSIYPTNVVCITLAKSSNPIYTPTPLSFQLNLFPAPLFPATSKRPALVAALM